MENKRTQKPFPVRLLLTGTILLVGIFLGILWFSAGSALPALKDVFGKGRPEIAFDAQRAYQDVEAQVALGPRIPGTEAHQKVQEWMLAELEASGWSTEVQQTTFEGQPVSNIIGKMGDGAPWIWNVAIAAAAPEQESCLCVP